MPAFKFKLNGVLRHRLQIERQKQRDTAIARQRVRDAEQELRELNQSMQATTLDLRSNHLIGKLDMAFIAAHRRYIASMQRKGDGLVQKIIGFQREALAQQLLLAEAAKRRKAIEKLKERRRELWLENEARLEAAALDEAGSQIFFARRAEEFAVEMSREMNEA